MYTKCIKTIYRYTYLLLFAQRKFISIIHCYSFNLLLFLLQKAKKSKKQKIETATSDSAVEDGPSTSKQARLEQPVTSDAKLTNGSKESKVVANGNSKLTNGSKGSKSVANGSTVRNPLSAAADLLKPGSIQKDSSKSTAYKSLFTTSDRAKNQMKGHWVTSNPYWM